MLAGDIAERIRRFVNGCREPVLVEDGEDALALERSAWVVEERDGRVLMEAWDARRNVVRRVTSVEREGPGQLVLAVRRFGARDGVLTLYDAARAGSREKELKGSRRSFREQFRRFLRRQLAGWRLEELSTEADLTNSLSPQYARALVVRAHEGWAALGAGAEADVAGSLTFGLIWLDYLRRRETERTIHGLVLYVPDGRQNGLLLRARWLDLGLVRLAVYAYSGDGQEKAIDPEDRGNLESRLEPCTGRPMGRPGEGPEHELELAVRGNIELVHAPLEPEPVYGQVPTVTGTDRGILDLLAVERGGRLVVLELKAGEDVHLPMQALDYWMRVALHAERNDFARQGYFTGLAVSRETPRLLLVGPALGFHPATETLVKFFSPAVEVERIGLAVKWDEEVRVMFRLPGAGRPEIAPCPWQTTLSRSGRQSST